MNTIRLYKNGWPYPHYGPISLYKTLQATPRNQDLKSGYIDIQLSFDEILEFNYLSFTRNGRSIYAWVENVEEKSGNKLYRVFYNIDAFRTYRGELVPGDQYVERSPIASLKYDPLLGSDKDVNNVERTEYTIGYPTKRYAIVQKKPDGDETLGPTPVQPSPYKFYACEYDINDWTATSAIRTLITRLTSNEESDNIVTIYSIPYLDITSLPDASITIRNGSSEPIGGAIDGWKYIDSFDGILTNFTEISIPNNLTQVKSTVMLVFPEAGIINVPKELFAVQGLGIRQDVDLYSGACNYMLASGGGLWTYHLSVRGSSMNSIPILSDPYDTYISQNQNTLTTSLLGDVASIGIGAATMASGVPLGGVSVGQGVSSLLSKGSNIKDAESLTASNPPAFLGSALATEFNQTFWQVAIYTNIDNELYVRMNMGYPCEKLQPLVIPASGYIKTQACNISSNGSVPLWAINQINQLLDNGILFHE